MSGNTSVSTKYCKFCGQLIDSDCVVCPKCGKQVELLRQDAPQVVINNTNTNPNVNRVSGGGMVYPQKSKITALILAIFLGGFGAHRFYVGKVGTGLLYLCTAGIGGIGWFIDIILILTGSFRDKANMPLK